MDIERWFTETRRRECGDKVRHDTQEDARREAELLSRVHGGGFSVYRCPWCGCWHVGSRQPY
jgi:rubrerythrin